MEVNKKRHTGSQKLSVSSLSEHNTEFLECDNGIIVDLVPTQTAIIGKATLPLFLYVAPIKSRNHKGYRSYCTSKAWAVITG